MSREKEEDIEKRRDRRAGANRESRGKREREQREWKRDKRETAEREQRVKICASLYTAVKNKIYII